MRRHIRRLDARLGAGVKGPQAYKILTQQDQQGGPGRRGRIRHHG